MLGKNLSDKKIPWKRLRRFGMSMAGNTQLHCLGKPMRCKPTTYRLELLIFGRGCVVIITKFFFQQQQYIYTDNAYIQIYIYIYIHMHTNVPICMTSHIVRQRQRKICTGLLNLLQERSCNDDKRTISARLGRMCMFLFCTFYVTNTHVPTRPLSSSSRPKARHTRWCQRHCLCIELNRASPRAQFPVTTLYDYVI